MKAAKKVANHVSRLSEVLDCASWLLFWQCRPFLWFPQIGRGTDVSTAPGGRIGPFFFSDTRSFCPKKAAVLLDETITTRVRQFDEAHSSQATSCRPGSTGCCRLAKATEQEYD